MKEDFNIYFKRDNTKIKLWAKKMKEKDPDYFKKLGSKGGKNGHTGGFAANPELAKLAGAKAAKVSKRKSKS